MARTAQPLDPAREEDLLLTSARHFASAGYAGTSLNNVIAEAGWGKSSFYHYFSNKRRLHDHVVSTLAARLVDGVRVPDLDTLSAAGYWTAMADLVEELGHNARRRPESWYLGEMFHRPVSDDDGRLQELREQVEHWLRRAISHGREIGVVRADLPEQLLMELALAVMQTLDRWAVRHKLHSPGGPTSPTTSVQVVRDLIERR
jgi:AcrR family transcriptional regulator